MRVTRPEAGPARAQRVLRAPCSGSCDLRADCGGCSQWGPPGGPQVKYCGEGAPSRGHPLQRCLLPFPAALGVGAILPH